MALQAGQRLGSFEVLAPLGAGGMGEVYRARDTRLGREVALKVLPESLGSTRRGSSRFEQEARAASALNHPNIVTIYEIGRDGDTTFIAMELVDGRTLRETSRLGLDADAQGCSTSPRRSPKGSRRRTPPGSCTAT